MIFRRYNNDYRATRLKLDRSALPSDVFQYPTELTKGIAWLVYLEDRTNGYFISRCGGNEAFTYAMLHLCERKTIAELATPRELTKLADMDPASKQYNYLMEDIASNKGYARSIGDTYFFTRPLHIIQLYGNPDYYLGKPTQMEIGDKIIDLAQFDHYKVTGLNAYSTKRFKAIVTDDVRHAMGINLWRGTVWGVRPNGTRKTLRKVWN